MLQRYSRARRPRSQGRHPRRLRRPRMSWTRLALSNPTATLVAVMLVALFGGLSLSRLPVQLTPEVERPEITIRTAWRAAAPEEVEAEIVEPQGEGAARAAGGEPHRLQGPARAGRGLHRVRGRARSPPRADRGAQPPQPRAPLPRGRQRAGHRHRRRQQPRHRVVHHPHRGRGTRATSRATRTMRRRSCRPASSACPGWPAPRSTAGASARSASPSTPTGRRRSASSCRSRPASPAPARTSRAGT